MENIRRKCNSIMDLLKFTSNKKIFWCCSPSLLPNFVHNLIILDQKKFRVVSNFFFFKDKKKIIKKFKFIYKTVRDILAH